MPEQGEDAEQDGIGDRDRRDLVPAYVGPLAFTQSQGSLTASFRQTEIAQEDRLRLLPTGLAGQITPHLAREALAGDREGRRQA